MSGPYAIWLQANRNPLGSNTNNKSSAGRRRPEKIRLLSSQFCWWALLSSVSVDTAVGLHCSVMCRWTLLLVGTARARPVDTALLLHSGKSTSSKIRARTRIVLSLPRVSLLWVFTCLRTSLKNSDLHFSSECEKSIGF